MPDRFVCRPLVWVALGLSLSTPALAHKLRVFAAAEGDLITGSAYFVGGGAASGAHIRVQDAQGRTLAEPTPDAEGRFSYRARSAEDLVVVAETGDGHRTEWRVPGAELAGAFAAGVPAPAQLPAAATPSPSAGPTEPTPATAVSPSPGGPAADHEALIERAVARQIRPLREELIAFQDQARLRDILGGIGYIVGLTGLALWWRSRQSPSRP